MTLSENLCRKHNWQIVDNELFNNIEDARYQIEKYKARGINCYLDFIGNHFKIVFSTSVSLASAKIKRKELKTTIKDRDVEIISLD